MNLDRLTSVLDTASIQTKHVAITGAGGSADFVLNLARCGIGAFTFVDFDTVDDANIARQGHLASAVGRAKVDALADRVRHINPNAVSYPVRADLTRLTETEIDRTFGQADLLVFATDSFAAQAKGNEIALRLGKPAIWVGLSRNAGAGEVFFWHPQLRPCFRCALGARYAAFEQALAAGRPFLAPSDGADIFSLSILDGIAGHIALGLLTRGANNRFGRLIDQLGDRQYLHVQLDPAWTLNARSVVREQLRVPADCDAYFAWCTAARRDDAGGEPPCRDCRRFRSEGSSAQAPISVEG